MTKSGVIQYLKQGIRNHDAPFQTSWPTWATMDKKNIPPIFTTATKSVGYDHKQHALQCLSATFATPINTNPLASPANADKMTNLDHKVAKMLHGLRIQVGVMDSHAVASCEVRTHTA